MSLLVEHVQESLAEQELEPGSYLETDILLARAQKRAMQAWLQTQGHGNITFWEPTPGGYRLSIHQRARKLLPAFQRTARRL